MQQKISREYFRSLWREKATRIGVQSASSWESRYTEGYENSDGLSEWAITGQVLSRARILFVELRKRESFLKTSTGLAVKVAAAVKSGRQSTQIKTCSKRCWRYRFIRLRKQFLRELNIICSKQKQMEIHSKGYRLSYSIFVFFYWNNNFNKLVNSGI